jgi:hypothetical protein
VSEDEESDELLVVLVVVGVSELIVVAMTSISIAAVKSLTEFSQKVLYAG